MIKPGMTLCVFCGSADGLSPEHRLLASRFGTLAAERGHTVVYGGGRVGLMGAVADAAIAAGGKVIGIIPEHIRTREVDHRGLSELIVVDTMHTRKMLMFERSDAFVVLPGGIGTLDELIEMATWRQLGLHEKPIYIVNPNGFWGPLRRLLEHVVTMGFAGQGIRDFFTWVPDIDALFDAE